MAAKPSPSISGKRGVQITEIEGGWCIAGLVGAPSGYKKDGVNVIYVSDKGGIATPAKLLKAIADTLAAPISKTKKI